jgi:hypothetical protein
LIPLSQEADYILASRRTLRINVSKHLTCWHVLD